MYSLAESRSSHWLPSAATLKPARADRLLVGAVVLYCIERADGDSLAYWLDCIKSGDEDCSIGNDAKFDWLLDVAAALLSQSA